MASKRFLAMQREEREKRLADALDRIQEMVGKPEDNTAEAHRVRTVVDAEAFLEAIKRRFDVVEEALAKVLSLAQKTADQLAKPQAPAEPPKPADEPAPAPAEEAKPEAQAEAAAQTPADAQAKKTGGKK